MARRQWLGMAAVAAALSAYASGAAAEDVPTIRLYQDWRLTCPALSDKGKYCELEQNVLDAKTRVELARLLISRTGGTETLLVTVPFNVLLEPGIGFGFGDAKPELFAFEMCNEIGCLIRIAFSGDFAEHFCSASSGRILFAELDGKPVGLPYSMKGFAEAYAAYLREEERR